MSDDKVIRAFPGRELPACPVTIEEQRGYCRHPRIVMSEHDRSVICAECSATLDPFDYLRNDAYAMRQGWERHRQVQQKIQQLREQCDLLEKEKRRLSGAVRRLKEKAGAPIDLHRSP